VTVYDVLGFPLIYKAAQGMLAPGMKQILTDRLRKAVAAIPASARSLDVGCGPASWLTYLGMNPVGLDLHRCTP
jgi:hypothetical protein